MQPRILTVLICSQILSGVGLAAGVTVASLLLQDMLETTALAGLGIALLTAGSAGAALLVGRVSQARGRRPGLAGGYLVGAIGGGGVVAGATIDSLILVLLALVLYGAGTAVNLQARYAGTDLVAPTHRARAIASVLVATTLGGVLGPNLAAPAGELAAFLGLPRLTGLFVLSSAAFALAAIVLLLWLRPDPLLLARSQSAAQDAGRNAPGAAGPAAEPRSARRVPSLRMGVLTLVLSQGVMVAIMTMTPVHMHAHGLGAAASGLVIAVHVAAMFLPSPLTGLLVDRCGPLTIVAAAAAALAAAGVLAAFAPGDSVPVLTLALLLLGLGWNAGLVSGTALVTEVLPPETRAKTQGLIDVAIAVAGAVGGLASGMLVSAADFAVLSLVGGVLAIMLLPAVVRGGAH
ncbi:MFS transporter [Nesterenkonia halophila]|uniref:MFS transporter n=1 Tax=Nesterenkonia halophila TaxID=302044 RepID=UPI001FE399AB|nr:MFS transporter [Nesterenkonia halophila]